MSVVEEAYRVALSGNIDDEAAPESQQAREMLRAGLADLLHSFQSIRGEPLMLHFHLPNGRSLVRLWREKNFIRNEQWIDISDDISPFRQTVMHVNRTGQPAQGLEIGRGGFTVRSVLPVISADDDHLGSVEMLIEFEPIVAAAAAGDEHELLLYMNHDLLEIAQRLQDPLQHPLVGDDFVKVSGTEVESINELISAELLQQARQGLTVETVEHYSLSAFPVFDFIGEQVGVMVYVLDTVSQQSLILNLTILLLVIITSLLLLLMLASQLSIHYFVVKPLNTIIGFFEKIAGGKLDNEIVVTQNDEIGKVMVGLRDMQAKLKADITTTQNLAAENLRIRYALDSVSSSVMVTDPEAKIIYANDAVITMFRKAAHALRQALPGFDPDRVRGAHFNLFNLNNVQRTLDTLSTTYESENELGGRTFKLVANPIADQDGTRLGSVIEWVDRTEVLKIEREVTDLVDGAVNGDLTRRIATDDLDGFYQRLGEGINRMVSQLQELIGQITESVDAINTGAREIAVGNSDLSQRTEEQASSLEETASSMEELTSTVKQNADNARQANQLSNSARDVATQGGTKINQAVQAMKDITSSSEKISDIITVIDGIAFQTNILALNAAVEAARAGEQGRGFAVVAGEVRNLAQRSASAAKEIKGLIAENSTTISSGSTLVLESGQTMEEIVTQAKRVSDLIAEISAASDEQSTGIDQVNTAITQMDEVTQQNASLVEQAAAASESLEEQAQALSQAVSIFRTSDHSTASAPSARALPTAKSAAKSAPAPRKKAAPQPSKNARSGANNDWEEF
jgi:methyl-accepting chemotaxis protein